MQRNTAKAHRVTDAPSGPRVYAQHETSAAQAPTQSRLELLARGNVEEAFAVLFDAFDDFDDMARDATQAPVTTEFDGDVKYAAPATRGQRKRKHPARSG